MAYLVNGFVVLTAVLAAMFWWLSARFRVPEMFDTTINGPGSIVDIMRKQSRLSAIAAGFAGLSAVGQIAAICIK